MKKYFWKILNVILILYVGFSWFKEYHPTFYGTSFNNDRIEIGLVPIDSNLVQTNKGASVYQIWKNKSTDIPGFYAKYISCDTWNRGIEMENDTYTVLVDSSKAIVSINYNFETKNFDYALKKYNRPRNTYDLYGHSGKMIKQLSKTEVIKILERNRIKHQLQ